MALRDADIDFEIFVRENGADGAAAVGAVRELHADHLIAWIENHGDTRIDAEHVVAAHDGKVFVDPGNMDAELREALARAHDAEGHDPSTGVSTD